MPHDEIRLVLPASPHYVRLARLTVAGLASRVGFTYDEVEDLRIAVGEACAIVMGPGSPGSPVELRFDLDPDEMRVVVDGHADHDARDLADTDLSRLILEAVVDSFVVGPSTVQLRKRRSAAGP